jgi:hypothetical protein
MSWVQESSCYVTRRDLNRELELFNQTLGCSYAGEASMRVETVDAQLIMTSLRTFPARTLIGAPGNKEDLVGIVLSGCWFLLERSQVSSTLLLLKGWCKWSEIHRLRVLPQVHIPAFWYYCPAVLYPSFQALLHMHIQSMSSANAMLHRAHISIQGISRTP